MQSKQHEASFRRIDVAAIIDGSRVLLDDGVYRIISLNNASASAWWGEGTRWCTTGNGWFAGYRQYGELLYIEHRPKGRRWHATELLAKVRAELDRLSSGDREALFAFRRKVYKELMYDERSKPMVRRALKIKMRKMQNGLCAICAGELPARNSVLDRFSAVDGYVENNVRLICEVCDRDVQQKRGFS